MAIGKKESQDHIIERAKAIHGNKYDYSESVYLGYRTKMKIKCNECKKFFWQTPASHLAGHNCKCYQGGRKTTEEFIEQAKKVHGDKFDYSLVDYHQTHEHITIICKTCGSMFQQQPGAHLRGSGCPRCAESFGTSRIQEWLVNHGIDFEREKVFDGLIHVGSLRYDFYLPKFHMAIEYKGEQHYMYTPFFHKNEEQFKDRQVKDQIKRNFAKKNNIKFLEIPYTQKEFIDQILFSEIPLNVGRDYDILNLYYLLH